MLNVDSFNRQIVNIIEQFEYPMYLVILQKELTCTCNHGTSKQGDRECPMCLGTGSKIKIYKIKGVWQPSDETVRGNTDAGSEKTLGSLYFKCINGRPEPKEYDLLVKTNGEVEVIYRSLKHRTNSNKTVFYECTTVRKRDNYDTFLKNFKNIVGDF